MALTSFFPEIAGSKSARVLLNKIERKLAEVPKEAESFVDNLDVLDKAFADLVKKHWQLFPQTSIEERKKLMKIIDEMVRSMKTTMEQHITEDEWTTYANENDKKSKKDEWEKFEECLATFRWLCQYKFEHCNASPLKFAQDNVKMLNYINDLEAELIRIIVQFNEHLPNTSDHILVKECNKLRNPRREIVITCLGSLKSTKSSFINFLLSRDICPTGNEESTARLTRIQYGDRQKVVLKSSDGKEKEWSHFKSDEELCEKVVEHVKLKGAFNRELGCKDEVIIQIPMDELKGIELWDIPGFDENQKIDEQIGSILANTDIIFALMPLNETVRRKFQEYVKLGIGNNRNIDKEIQCGKSCRSFICFVITRIDQFCVDAQTRRSREEILQQLSEKLAETFKMQLCECPEDHRYTSSNRFIPMCTNARFNIHDYLECRDQFNAKSSKWYHAALTELIALRLDWLQAIIQQVLDFEHAQQVIELCKELKTKIRDSMLNIDEELAQMMEPYLEKMKNGVYDSVEAVTEAMVTYLATKDKIETEDINYVETTIDSTITKEYAKHLNDMQNDITQVLTQRITNLGSSVGLSPQQRQMLSQALLTANGLNLYQFQNGTYTVIADINTFAPIRKTSYVTVGGLIVGGTLSAAALIALAVSTGGVAVALGACAAAAIGFTTIHDGISNAFANVKIMWSSSSKRKTQQKHIQNDIVSRLKPALAEKHKEIVKEAHKWLRNMIDAQAKLFNSSIDAKKKQFKTR